MVSTAGALLAVGECDSELHPPIMVFVPEVRCNSRTYYLAVLCALALGTFYMTYLSVLLLESIARFNQIAKPVYRSNYAEYAVKEGQMALEIQLPEELQASEDLQAAILDAHQVCCQQALQRAHPQLATLAQPDLGSAAGIRLLVVNEELRAKTKASCEFHITRSLQAPKIS